MHRAIRCDRSILGWDSPISAYVSVLTNGRGGDNDDEDNDEDDEDNDEENNSEGDGDEKHGQLLLCLHSCGDMSFGDGGAIVFWLPYEAIPEDPEHSDPSQFNFNHWLDN